MGLYLCCVLLCLLAGALGLCVFYLLECRDDLRFYQNELVRKQVQLDEEVQARKTKYDKLCKERAELHEHNSQLQHEHAQLIDKNSALTRRIQELAEEFNDQLDSVKDLDQMIADLQDDVDDLYNERDSLKQTVGIIADDVDQSIADFVETMRHLTTELRREAEVESLERNEKEELC